MRQDANCLHVKSHARFLSGTFRNMWPVPNVTVFFSYLCLSLMFLGCFLNDFGMVPVVLMIDGIAIAFTFHTRCIAIVKYLRFKTFSATLFIIFLYLEIIMSINGHFPFPLLRFMISSLLLKMVLLVFTCWLWLPCVHIIIIIIIIPIVFAKAVWLVTCIRALWYPDRGSKQFFSSYQSNAMLLNKITLRSRTYCHIRSNASVLQPFDAIWPDICIQRTVHLDIFL